MFQQILVAFDGSNVARQALQKAITLAKDQHAPLRIVSVFDLGSLYWTPVTGVNVAEIEQAVIQQTQQELSDAAGLARQEGVAAETALRRADGRRVSDEIVAEAKDWPADLIVLGTHGRGGIGRLVLGSVAEGVARAAPVPVLLVRGQ
ncbi:MAG TPA: universal stress protein [Chloroflexota bacterium]|nr:universal stress protein [Chloroflexota bacterium]